MASRLAKLEFEYGDKVRVYNPDSEFYDHLGEVRQVEQSKVTVVLNIHKTARTVFKPCELESYDDSRKRKVPQHKSLEDNWG